MSVTGDKLLRRHAAGFALPAQPRAHDEIGRTARDRSDHVRQERRHVAAVTVEEADDVGIVAHGRKTSRAGAAIAAARLAEHARTRRARARRGRIARAVVDHDHLVDTLRQHAGDDARDRLFFIQTRNDDADDRLRAGKPHQALSRLRMILSENRCPLFGIMR
jgi:hypothetical protein